MSLLGSMMNRSNISSLEVLVISGLIGVTIILIVEVVVYFKHRSKLET